MNNHQLKTSFMQSPLVTWARTLLEDNCADYSELFNGSFLNKAWLQIDPHPPYLCNNSITSEAASLSRIKNLNILLNNIRAFYENVLDQILVIRLPDVINIALNCSDDLLMSVSPDSSFYTLINSYSTNACSDDMRTFLLLILGCAVQCDQKEVFIEKIKQLDISVQHSIVECIQQITDNPESVFMVSEWSEPPLDELEKDRLYSIFVSHISNLTKERDQLYQRVVRLSHELFNLTFNAANFSQTNSTSLKNLSLSNSSLNNNINHCDQKSHYLVELADVKSKLRRLQQELEEKNEVVVELKEIIEQNKEFCNKLRHDNLELTQEARTAKAYRDEIDVLNERVRKIDRLEAEVQRYRDKMNELEFYKSRVEELREDNRILGETKTMLEEQLDSSRKRAEKLPELEEKILKLNAFGNELNLQRELDRNQIERLVEEVTHLRQEKKFAIDELSKVQLELTDLRAQMRLNNETMLMKNDIEEGNLYDQINQDTSKRLIKLEHENQKLKNLLEDYKNNSVDIDSLLSLFPGMEYYSMHTEEDANSNKDNENSSDNGGSEIHSTDSGYNSNKSKIEKLNDIKDYIEKQKVNQNNIKSLENVKFELEKEIVEFKKRLHDEFNKYEAMERNYSQSIAENQKYQRIIEQKTKKIEDYSSELSAIESENQKLVANADSLKLSLRKLNDLEIEMTGLESDKHRLEQEKKSLDKEINRLKTSIEFKDNVIDENAGKLSTFELENKRLKKEIEANNQITFKLKEVEKENKDLANSVIVQKNTLSALQQDLVNEKLRAQKYVDEFEKIVETINKLCLDNCLDEVTINIPKDTSTSNDNLSFVISNCFRGVVDNCLSQKNVQITDLESQLSHLKANNEELQTVINSLKKQLRIGTESSDKSSLSSLSELQRSIDYFENENKCLKSKLSIQTELNSEMKIKQELIESKLVLINDRNSELQNEIAKLEVENSLLKSQNCSLENQTTQLQEQMVSIQDSIESLKVKCEEYESAHKLLIADNESLQEIHQQLTADYDNLTRNHGIIKQLNKSLKSENKSLEEEFKSHLRKHDEIVNKTNEELKSLRDRKEREEVEDLNLKEKMSSLVSEHKNISEEHKRLQTEHKMLQNIYKKLRSDNNELKLKHTELQGETAECKDRMNALNVEVSKLSNYCEMVALTNNTLEAQRKKLATQSTSLLSQYNDLLLDLSSSSCEKSVIDKLRDLCIKKERLEKMFKEYDISIEKNMPRVSNKSQLFKMSDGQVGLDDTIYGRLWEAETPPIHNSDSTASSAALLRQFSLNSNLLVDKDKKFNDFSRSSPPRIPPRHGFVRQPVSSLSHHNSNESSIKPLSQISYSPTDVNKMSINVSTRTPANQLGKPQDIHAIESNLSKLQLLSAANSPLISKATSTVNSSPAVTNSGSYFMRGAFKSNSVNYGNYIRRPIDPKLNVANSGNSSASKHDHFSPQFLNAAANRKYMDPSLSVGLVSHRSNYQHHPASPSYHSDSSSSSHTPLEDSEKESDHVVYICNGNVCSAATTASNNNTNNNMSTRSRITISNNCITVANDGIKSINVPSGPTSNKDNISIQISNVMNNNLTEMTTVNCTNGISNDNSNSNTNSIWYEYGCV